LSCRAYAIYQVGQSFDRIFLINSELNLYLVCIQNEMKIWDQNLNKFKAYDFGMKIPLQTVKVLESGRNSVVFMGTEKHLFAL
jgi:3-isopropylmalate dehydratase small subunit